MDKAKAIIDKFDNNSFEKYSNWKSKDSTLLENKFLDDKFLHLYTKNLDEYRHHISSDKVDKLHNDRHWKLHLNVEPNDCLEVSNYLKNNDYNHKFLSGGDISDGKIFTVYIGSFEKARRESKKLHTDLEHVLKKPAAKHNAYFSEGISGRFSNSGKNNEKFISQGFHGFPHFNVKYDTIENKDKKIRESFEILKNKYGSYFLDLNVK
jgi:hypothetical protein